MKHKLNSKKKHNLGRMASPSNPSTKLKAFHDKLNQDNKNLIKSSDLIFI